MIAFEDYLYQAKVLMITKSVVNTLLPVHGAGRSRRPLNSLIPLGRQDRQDRQDLRDLGLDIRLVYTVYPGLLESSLSKTCHSRTERRSNNWH